MTATDDRARAIREACNAFITPSLAGHYINRTTLTADEVYAELAFLTGCDPLCRNPGRPAALRKLAVQ